MKKVDYIYLLFVTGLILFNSCGTKRIESVSHYLNYINDKGNGLYFEKQVGEYNFSIKLLPAEYLMIQELSSLNGVSQNYADSLSEIYNNNLSFLFSVETAIPNGGKVNKSSTNASSFEDKANDLYLRLRDSFIIKSKSGMHESLILGTMENTGGLNKGVSYYLVFHNTVNEQTNAKTNEFILEFIDNIFSNEIVEFQFRNSDIENIPKLNLEYFLK